MFYQIQHCIIPYVVTCPNNNLKYTNLNTISLLLHIHIIENCSSSPNSKKIVVKKNKAQDISFIQVSKKELMYRNYCR